MTINELVLMIIERCICLVFRQSWERDNHLDRDIPSHIGNADVLQSTQMGHEGLVDQIGADNVQEQAGRWYQRQVIATFLAGEHAGEGAA